MLYADIDNVSLLPVKPLTSYNSYLRDEIVSVTNRVGASEGTGFAYTYDLCSRPVAWNETCGCTYNERGEVISSAGTNWCESIAYDGIGNLDSSLFTWFSERTSCESYHETDYAANGLNQYTSISRQYGAGFGPESETSFAPSYDSDGNLTTYGPWTYAYDAKSRLVSVASNGMVRATMAYDAQDRRVKKVDAEGMHRYTYDGWLLVRETIESSDATTVTIDYVWGKDLSGTREGAGGVGGLLYLKRNGVIYIPFYDAFGNITSYWDENGTVVAEYTYDVFGDLLTATGPQAEDFAFRYSTKYCDAESRLYYYGYRYYSPNLRRWLTRDPIAEEGGLNLYGVCGNNALSRFDILGLKRWVMLYYSRDDQPAFRLAAETMKRVVEKRRDFNHACDKVIMKGALTDKEVKKVWKEIQHETDKSGEENMISELHLFLHSGPGIIYLRMSSLQALEIEKLDVLNWSADAKVVCHGCNSGIDDFLGDSVAGSFAKRQGVLAEGQSGFSQFSTLFSRRGLMSFVTPFSDKAYLWSYGDGGPNHTYGNRRRAYLFWPDGRNDRDEIDRLQRKALQIR